MVGPRALVHVDAVSDPLWTTALGLLRSGQAAVGVADLTLHRDPPTDQDDALLHVEFPCPVDPLAGGGPPSLRLAGLASEGLEGARRRVREACAADRGFRALVAASDVRYSFVYDYGTGAVLVARAAHDGELIWT